MHQNYLHQLSECGVDIQQWHQQSFKNFLQRESDLSRYLQGRFDSVNVWNTVVVLH